MYAGRGMFVRNQHILLTTDKYCAPIEMSYPDIPLFDENCLENKQKLNCH